MFWNKSKNIPGLKQRVNEMAREARKYEELKKIGKEKIVRKFAYLPVWLRYYENGTKTTIIWFKYFYERHRYEKYVEDSEECGRVSKIGWRRKNQFLKKSI